MHIDSIAHFLLSFLIEYRRCSSVFIFIFNMQMFILVEKKTDFLFVRNNCHTILKCAEIMCKYLSTHYCVASAAHWKINKESILTQRKETNKKRVDFFLFCSMFICWQFDRYGTYRLCNAHICQQSHRSEPAVTYKAADFGFHFDVDWIEQNRNKHTNNCIAIGTFVSETKQFQGEKIKIQTNFSISVFPFHRLYGIMHFLLLLLKTITLQHIWWHTSA